jgi:hypothetical protein
VRKQRTEIINKIFDRTPGIYLHISFKAMGFFLALLLIVAVICIRTVHISFNPPPAEYPFFIDGKKIVFLGREPSSMAEARDILASYKTYIKDGARVAVPEKFND